MTREPIKSSTIRSIGHDAEAKTLEVEFHQSSCVVRIRGTSCGCNCSGGEVWQYAGVPPEEHSMLMNAPSVGSRFAKYFKAFPERYRAARVTTDERQATTE